MNGENKTPDIPTPIETTPAVSNSALITSKKKEQAFLLYTIFCGDAVKTAHAVGLTPAGVAKMAEDGGWDDKISEILALRKSDKPGDLERAINRAINYVQAHRYRQQIERIISKVSGWSDEELAGMILSTSVDKSGTAHHNLTCRPFADLSAALEKAHTLTYLALGDTASDRSRRKEDQDTGVIAATHMHQQIAKAMEGVSMDTPRSIMESAQLELAEDIKAEEAPLDIKPKQVDPPTPEIPPL